VSSRPGPKSSSVNSVLQGALPPLVLLAGAASAGPNGGGTIAGTVRIETVPQRPAAQKITKDVVVCGPEPASEAIVVGPNRGLANVVVWLKGAKVRGPLTPTANAAIDQVGCRYTPHVQAVTVGSPLTLLNNDAVFHNVHGTLQAGASPTTVFNVAMPWKGQKLPQALKRPGVIKLRCDAGHTWMSAYVHVFDHPYFAVTDAKGTFTLAGVPPGTYLLELWHEPTDDKGAPATKTMTVEVSEARAATIDTILPL